MKSLKIMWLSLAAILLCLAMVMPLGCGDKPAETTAPETTLAPETTKAPETTVAPVETTEAPAETTEAPIETTEAPAETTEAPAETTEAPAETTEAPAETTEAPAETTEAPAETTEAPVETTETPVETTEAPAETTEAPAESTPEPEVKGYSISYDLDGGILKGNPLVYSGSEDLKLITPIKPGYDFIGWTGTGIDTPTASLTIPAGTKGDLSFKANWKENGEFEFKLDKTTTDALGGAFFGKTKVTFVVNGEDAPESGATINASNELIVQAFQRYFESHKQVVKVMYDNILESNTTDYDFMMYFGISDCEPVEQFMSTLNYAQYGISITEDSLSFIAWTEAANAEAAAILYEIIEHVVNGGSISDFAGGRYVGTVKGTVGESLPALPGLDGGTDVGEGAYQIYSIESTKEIYDAYLKSLEDAGYTLHTTNVMNKTYCATYYNATEVVNVMFAGDMEKSFEVLHPDHSLRVVVDPISITALPSTEIPADADSDAAISSVTLLYPHNLCMVFQLTNGHFIVLDSGNNGTQKEISDFLRDKAPDGKPVVEAWIFSHFHQDHLGGFIEYMNISSLSRYVTVKSIIYNFPSERVYMTASHSGTDMSNLKFWYTKTIPTLKENGTTVYQARTGQKYYFGNAEIEILWTYEDITPLNIFEDNTNRTSIGFSLTIEGQKFMLVGDSSWEEFKVAAARYGDYLKADYVQLAHHGAGTGDYEHDFYKKVNAPVVFHPDPGDAYPPWRGLNEIWAMENADLVIRTGNYGTATLTLPFNIGDTIESQRQPVLEPYTKEYNALHPDAE